MQTEPVFRLISVDGTFRCVHLFIYNYYRLSRKETRSVKRNYCFSVKQERASVHFDYAFCRCFIFLSSHIISLSLVSFSPNDIYYDSETDYNTLPDLGRRTLELGMLGMLAFLRDTSSFRRLRLLSS